MAAYANFGYSYPSASQLLASGGQTTTASAQSPISATNAPSLSPSGASGTGAPSGALSPGAMSQTSTTNAPATTSCCENGRPMITDPVSGQTVCSCQYDSARIALSGYSRIPTASVYGTPYPSTDQNPYPSIGVDSSAFYSPLSNPYTLKESGPTAGDMSAWTSAGLPPTTGYYTYDPTLTAYGYGAGYDLAARRKNATRESTATLKAWLNEHKKNPYPTKGEKIMLAIITKMTLTQVSTWFANARRRLKKENKMTWEPKNKTDDDDDAIVSDDEKDKDDDKDRDHKDSLHRVKSEHEKDDDEDDLTDDERKAGHHHDMLGHSQSGGHHYHPYYHPSMFNQHHLKSEIDPKNQTGSDCGVPIPASKPKIWSLADTAACKTPPPHHHMHQQQHPGAAAAYNPNHHWMSGGSYEQQGLPSQQHHQQMQQQQHQHQHSQGHLQGAPPHHQNGSNPMQMMSQLASGIPMGQQQTPGSMSGGHQHLNSSNMGATTMGSGASMGGMAGSYDSYTRYGATQGAAGFLGGNPYPGDSNSTPPVSQQMAPNMPVTSNPQQQQQQTRSPHQGAASMGFPEVQTDTPPQTPPNMKLPSVVGSLSLTSNSNNPATPTTATCFSNGSASSSSSGYASSPDAYMGSFRMSATTPTTTDSPQKRQEFNNNTMMSNNNGSPNDYKTFFKNSPQMNGNGFVPPV